MLIVETLPLLRQHIRRLCQEGECVALIPTMGNLHDGHVKLVDEARARADTVFTNIFANPMQFDRPDDLVRYPRTLQEDCEKPNKRKVNYVFAPAVEEICPQGLEGQTFVDVPSLSTMLEGASRPSHFRGVSAIISKLFNLIQPDIACFGGKDFQQLTLIRKMVVNMGYDVEVVDVPIIRAKDGLILSSHSGYLMAGQCKIAPGLHNAMNGIAERLIVDNRELQEIIIIAEQELNGRGFRTDGVQTRGADMLLELTETSERAVIPAAVWLGQAYLIDNQNVILTQQAGVRNRAILFEDFLEQASRTCLARINDRVQKL